MNQTAPLFLPQELDQNQCIHGRPQKFFQGCGQRRNFAYPFQVTNGAMQMDVHKTIYPFYTTRGTRGIPMLRQQSQKCCSLVAIHSLIFIRCENTGLTTMGSHCLFGLPATDDCFQQSRAEKRPLPPVTSSKPLEICCSFCYSCCCLEAFATRFQIKQIN